MKRIGITGPTGAGKTTALQALVELDAHIIDADAVYHALLESSAPLRAALTVSTARPWAGWYSAIRRPWPI